MGERPLVRVVRSPDLRRLAGAYVVFVVAELATYLAILVVAFEQGGTGAVGLVAALQLFPAAVLAPVAAVAGDRFGPATLIRAQYLFLLAACAGGAAALWADAPVGLAYAAAVAVSVIVSGTRPLHHGLLPELADGPADLTAANGVLSGAEGAGSLVAPLLVGVLLAVSEPAAVFAVSAALLLPALIGLATVRDRHRRPAVQREVVSAREELIDGLRVVRHGPGARAALIGTAVIYVAVGAVDVLAVPLAVDELAAGEAAVGWLSAGLGAGLVVGGALAGMLAGRAHLSRWVAQGLVLWGAVLALVGWVPAVAFGVVAFLIAGTGAAVAEVAIRTLLQRLVPGPLLTRALGLAESLLIGSTFVGAVVAAPLAAAVGVPTAFAVIGGATVVAALVAGLLLARAERATAAPERQLALLRHLRIARSLDPPELEALAQALERCVVAPGEAVIVEGDVGDRFYVVERGTFAVTRDGASIAELGPGDHFGEVALLYDEPRNATVTASGTGEVWALERDDFVEAMTGTPHVDGIARTVAEGRR